MAVHFYTYSYFFLILVTNQLLNKKTVDKDGTPYTLKIRACFTEKILEIRTTALSQIGHSLVYLITRCTPNHVKEANFSKVKGKSKFNKWFSH